MASDLEDLPENARIAMEWTTFPDAKEFGLFDEDPEIAERLRSITAAILECGIADNTRLITDLLTVLGAVPPVVHGPLLLLLSKENPETVSKAFRALSSGGQAQRFAYRSLIETFGRFARHGLMVDVMGDEDMAEHVKTALMRAKGKR